MSDVVKIKHQAFSLPVVEVHSDDIQAVLPELLRSISLNVETDYDKEYDKELRSLIPCVISLKQILISPTSLAQLVEGLRQVNLQAIGLQTENPDLAEHATYAGLTVFNERLNQYDLFQQVVNENLHSELENEPLNVEGNLHEYLSNQPSQIHRGNIAAGEQVYAEGQDLIVLGDVAADAEIIADGSIHVGGTLQGKAYAGNSGLMNADQATISAYVFEPELVSISGFYQLNEDIKKQYLGLPAKVRFAQQKLIYELDE